ncbi:MAG: DUF5011 domain-containing protein [Bacteroidia bacterium]|nr:DUF5011 domain-containing protein [Bacteroidia bacterium]
MKTKLFSLLLTVTIITACKKDKPEDPAPTTPTADTTPPVITLTGKQSDTCYMTLAYTDPGATANDNTDGNITSSILVTGTVNTAVTGDYILQYNVKDAANNSAATVSRTVHVLNPVDFLNGNYAVTGSYTAMILGATSTITSSSYTATAVASTTINNGFNISTINLGPTQIVPYSTTVNNNIFSISYFNGSYPKSTASGTICLCKNSFTIETVAYDQMYPSRTHHARNIFVKQ